MERRTENRRRAEGDPAEPKARAGCRRHQGDGRYRGRRYRHPQADGEPARDAAGQGSRRPRQAGRTQGQAQEKEIDLMTNEDRTAPMRASTRPRAQPRTPKRQEPIATPPPSRARQHGEAESVAACPRGRRAAPAAHRAKSKVKKDARQAKPDANLRRQEKSRRCRSGWPASKAAAAGQFDRISLSDDDRVTPAPATRSSIASWSRRRKPAPEASGTCSSTPCPPLRRLRRCRDAT
jgi:hypothetical protein